MPDVSPHTLQCRCANPPCTRRAPPLYCTRFCRFSFSSTASFSCGMSRRSADRPARTMSKPTGRLRAPLAVSEKDVGLAHMLAKDACPRRYCWWWHSLSFTWEASIAAGCRLTQPGSSPFPPDVPCCRLDPTSARDFYEPREPHLEADGFTSTHFGPQPAAPRLP